MRLIQLLTVYVLIINFSCASRTEEKSLVYVNDHAFILEDEEEKMLTGELKELERSIGSQMVILIIDSLRGQKIDEYSLNIANEWGIGRKEYDDGVLITMSMAERQVRIEVGYGLERIIKDEIAARIIREDMAPLFLEKKYYEGLLLGVQKMKTLIKANKELVGQK